VLPWQGCVAEQPPAQIVPEQVLGEQVTVWAAGQAPWPSQDAASVATLLVQLAARHDTVVSGKVQVVRLAPVQLPWQAPAPPQAVRVPRGAPEVTAVQWPMVLVSAQASHWPVQLLSQQTPSTQKVELQSAPALQESPLACLAGPPSAPSPAPPPVPALPPPPMPPPEPA